MRQLQAARKSEGVGGLAVTAQLLSMAAGAEPALRSSAEFQQPAVLAVSENVHFPVN